LIIEALKKHISEQDDELKKIKEKSGSKIYSQIYSSIAIPNSSFSINFPEIVT
jgi:hypothetical protein